MKSKSDWNWFIETAETMSLISGWSGQVCPTWKKKCMKFLRRSHAIGCDEMVSLSVSVCVCVCVCPSWIEEAETRDESGTNWPHFWCYPESRAGVGKQVLTSCPSVSVRQFLLLHTQPKKIKRTKETGGWGTCGWVWGVGWWVGWKRRYCRVDDANLSTIGFRAAAIDIITRSVECWLVRVDRWDLVRGSNRKCTSSDWFRAVHDDQPRAVVGRVFSRQKSRWNFVSSSSFFLLLVGSERFRSGLNDSLSRFPILGPTSNEGSKWRKLAPLIGSELQETGRKTPMGSFIWI